MLKGLKISCIKKYTAKQLVIKFKLFEVLIIIKEKTTIKGQLKQNETTDKWLYNHILTINNSYDEYVIYSFQYWKMYFF